MQGSTEACYERRKYAAVRSSVYSRFALLLMEDNIVWQIHQHNSISSRDQLCQDSRVETVQFQLRNAMPHPYFCHHPSDMESAQWESRGACWVYGGYLFEYYQLWDMAARHAVLRGCLIPIINTTLIESSTTTYLILSFSPHLILELYIQRPSCKSVQIKPVPKPISNIYQD